MPSSCDMPGGWARIISGSCRCTATTDRLADIERVVGIHRRAVLYVVERASPGHERRGLIRRIFLRHIQTRVLALSGQAVPSEGKNRGAREVAVV